MPDVPWWSRILGLAGSAPMSNDDLARDVGEALRNDHVLRVTLSSVRARAQDGIVTLAGYALSDIDALRAGQTAHAVPGVVGVENELVSDTSLQKRVAQALGRDSRTTGYPYAVDAFCGVVRVSGRDLPSEVQAAARRVAATVPGVRAVESGPGDPRPYTVPFARPARPHERWDS